MAGSNETRFGDVVCIFLGATAPFILRDEPEDRYTLICEAHVYGIMDGELMEKSLKIQQFDVKLGPLEPGHPLKSATQPKSNHLFVPSFSTQPTVQYGPKGADLTNGHR